MNKVILIGRLTRDAEIRYTTNNNAVAAFTIAVDRRAKAGEEKTADFINVVAWNKTAETIEKYFKKGSQIAIAGRLQTRTWEDEQGQKHHVTEVVVEEFDFTGSKKPTEETPETMGFSETDDIIGEDDDLPF